MTLLPSILEDRIITSEEMAKNANLTMKVSLWLINAELYRLRPNDAPFRQRGLLKLGCPSLLY